VAHVLDPGHAVRRHLHAVPGEAQPLDPVQIADGQLITITPGFDNQFRTPFADGQQLAIMLDGRFTGWTGVGNGGIVMVRPAWPDVTRGKQRIAFYDTNSRLVGWDWIKVDWSW
jgi:hypothetical protein